jgi:hypothetical protein
VLYWLMQVNKDIELTQCGVGRAVCEVNTYIYALQDVHVQDCRDSWQS